MSHRITRSSYLKNNREFEELETYNKKKKSKKDSKKDSDKEIKQVKTNYFFVFYNFTYKYVVLIIKVSGIYLLWIFLHFVATHLYVNFCVPKSVMGFIMSPLMVAAPHCYTFRWCITNGANNISTMWVVFGTWIASKFAILVTNRPVAPQVVQ
jgi:hypothetical protein